MSVASTTVRARSGPALASGTIAGIAGAVAMAMFAMIAGATYHGVGFFTPMYHIASSLISPETMMISVGEAQAGNQFYFAPGPAMLGLMLHLAVGIVFGVLFAVGVGALRFGGRLLVPIGIVYGGVVLIVMSFVGLPVTAAIFDGGDPIRNMPSMAGWWTFAIEHLMYGAVLGAWLLIRGSRRPQPMA